MSEKTGGSAVPATPGRVLAAFAVIYLVWGSTFLAIRIAIETLPPLLMAGGRFLTAGALLYGWRRARGVPRPTRREWAAAAIVGTALLLGGNGAVVWAEQTVPSGVAALLVTVMPLWMVLLDWLRPGGERPPASVLAGVVVGLGGVAFLIGPDAILRGAAAGVNPVGAGVLLFGSLSWAAGSLYARNAPLPHAPLLGTGMQMLAGGAALLVVGLATGETAHLDLGHASTRSIAAVIYLIIFGAIAGYSAYTWLLRVVPAAKVATYAYVNPVIAVILGWALAGEPLGARTLLAAAVIVGSVAVITAARPRVARTPDI